MGPIWGYLEPQRKAPAQQELRECSGGKRGDVIGLIKAAHPFSERDPTADDINPTSLHMYYTTIIPRAGVHKVMQDLYLYIYIYIYHIHIHIHIHICIVNSMSREFKRLCSRYVFMNPSMPGPVLLPSSARILVKIMLGPY